MVLRDCKITCFMYSDRSRDKERKFSVVFSIKENETTILFGQQSTNYGFLIALDESLRASDWFDTKNYNAFCSIFELSALDRLAFNPAKFLRNFDASEQIPSTGRESLSMCRGLSISNPTLPGGVEFFDHFVCHKIREPSDENLEKTEKAFGSAITEFCKKSKVSTNWASKRPSPNARPGVKVGRQLSVLVDPAGGPQNGRPVDCVPDHAAGQKSAIHLGGSP
jgi:hypothetical protein